MLQQYLHLLSVLQGVEKVKSHMCTLIFWVSLARATAETDNIWTVGDNSDVQWEWQGTSHEFEYLL